MVRNSPLLCPELVRAGALEALLALVQDAPPGAAQGVGDGQNPLKISLFSLGNLCSHAACRAHLAALGLREAVQPLAVSPDGATAKYAQRVLQKLGPPATQPEPPQQPQPPRLPALAEW